MRVAFLEDAEQARVADLVVDVLKSKDAVVNEHTHSHVRFTDLNPGTEYAFAKGGYVGTFQHAGETEVELRVRVEAAGPRAWFHRISVASVLVTLGLFVLDASGSLWVTLGVFFWALFIGSFLVFLGTWRTSWVVEQQLMDDLLARIREDARAAADFERMEERELARFEEALEAEILELQLKAARKKGAPLPATAGGAGTAPAAPAPADDAALDAKRARLEALRAERERRRRDHSD